MIERTVAVDGATIRYIEDGQGPVVLLLHGGTLGCSADDWRNFIPLLAAGGFRAIAYDQAGFGTNDAPFDHSLAFRGVSVFKFLDALHIRCATVVGHSQSGRLALNLTLAPQERVEAGVVLCTGSLLPPLGDRGARASEPDREPTLDETRALLVANIHNTQCVTDALVERFHRFSTGANFRNALMRAAAPEPSPVTGAGWQRLEDALVPLMLVYGVNDKGSIADRVDIARERYPQLPIHLLERCGHFAQWDQPETLAQLIIDFLEARPSSTIRVHSSES